MTCDQILREIPDYLEGLLEAPEAARVAEHLSACPACRAEAERQEAVWEMLGADEPVEAPADLARRVLERAAPREGSGPAGILRFVPRRRWAVPALAAAAVLVLAVGALVLQRASKEAPPLAGLTEEERQVVAHLDLLEDYELLDNLDMVENLELLENQEVVQNL